MREVTLNLPFWVQLIGFLFLGAGLLWGFQAVFKSGKLEKKGDAWFDKVLADPSVPAGVKTVAQRAKDLDLTGSAQAIKGFVDPRVDAMEIRIRELEAKLPRV
jgi:hypothetical protein